ISAGRFTVLEVEGQAALEAELQRLNPAELLVAEGNSLPPALGKRRGLRQRPAWECDLDGARRALCRHFGTDNLDGFGCAGLGPAIQAAGCLLQYARETQHNELPHIRSLRVEQPGDSLILDAASRRNLEIEFNLSGG